MADTGLLECQHPIHNTLKYIIMFSNKQRFGLRSLSGILKNDPKPVSDYAVGTDKSVRGKNPR